MGAVYLVKWTAQIYCGFWLCLLVSFELLLIEDLLWESTFFMTFSNTSKQGAPQLAYDHSYDQ